MAASEESNSDFSFFSGSVNDAIKKIKDDNTCLLVYVFGEDDTSKKYDAYFSSGGKLANFASKFVCMRLAAQSDTALQFSAFYPVVSLPTIYLINANGISLEALIGDRSEDDLVARLSVAAETAGANVALVGPSIPAASAAAPDWDSRVARIEEKIDAKQAEKAREAAEKERQAELDRRNVGRSLHQLRQQQQAEQERAWAEEVRQERMARYKEQQKAKQQQQQPVPPAPPEQEQQQQQEEPQDVSLREFRESQSSAYKEQRRAAEAAKQAAEAAAAEAEREAAAAAESDRRKTARLQLRCPDGGVLVRELPSAATLADLFASVSDASELVRSGLQGGRFRLATVYPRRVFDLQAEAESSLAQLDLAPSASLLVLPPVEARAGDVAGGRSVASALATPLILIGRLLALLIGFLSALFGFGGRGGEGASSQSPQPQARTTEARRPVRGGGGGGATVEREGNTARLRNLPRPSGRNNDANKDDDDDGATWNGNSTQQM